MRVDTNKQHTVSLRRLSTHFKSSQQIYVSRGGSGMFSVWGRVSGKAEAIMRGTKGRVELSRKCGRKMEIR